MEQRRAMTVAGVCLLVAGMCFGAATILETPEGAAWAEAWWMTLLAIGVMVLFMLVLYYGAMWLVAEPASRRWGKDSVETALIVSGMLVLVMCVSLGGVPFLPDDEGASAVAILLAGIAFGVVLYLALGETSAGDRVWYGAVRRGAQRRVRGQGVR